MGIYLLEAKKRKFLDDDDEINSERRKRKNKQTTTALENIDQVTTATTTITNPFEEESTVMEVHLSTIQHEFKKSMLNTIYRSLSTTMSSFSLTLLAVPLELYAYVSTRKRTRKCQKTMKILDKKWKFKGEMVDYTGQSLDSLFQDVKTNWIHFTAPGQGETIHLEINKITFSYFHHFLCSMSKGKDPFDLNQLHNNNNKNFNSIKSNWL